MKAALVSADQTGKYALSVTGDGKVVLYSNNVQGLNSIKTFDINSKSAQFLPPSLGLAFISGDSKGYLTIYHKNGLVFDEYKIDNFHEFTSDLRVSTYPPQTRVACISGNSIIVFEIVFNEKPELLLLRKYSNVLGYISFGFGPNNTIWSVSKNSLICKFDLSSNKPESLLKEGTPIYISASPVSSNSCAVLYNDSRVVVFVGTETTEFEHQVKGASIIEWSPLGASIFVYGDDVEEWKQVSPNVWRLSK
jgi:hypothetical protein